MCEFSSAYDTRREEQNVLVSVAFNTNIQALNLTDNLLNIIALLSPFTYYFSPFPRKMHIVYLYEIIYSSTL